ncbi:HIT family protein [bacterium]|nr:HIT family protein [bacterium]
MNNTKCTFCNIDREIIIRSDLCFSIYDNYPVNKGHVLVIPYRHIHDYFKLSQDEIDSLWKQVNEIKIFLDGKYEPDGYNIGLNVGRAAGQTIDHVHIHVIPRYKGDMEDPTGGVRHVIPERGKY